MEAVVRVKKRDGEAEFSEKGLKWTPDALPGEVGDDASSKPIVVNWSSVQDQQVSSLSSPKAMIRLRMTNNVTLVLEFVSTKGLEAAFEVREKAKELIAQCIAASGRQKASMDRTPLCNATEIKQRAALLAANPILKRQHTEMVNQGLISEEDFWATRRHLIANEASKRQKTGKTSAILTDLTSDNDSGGVVKYNLNAEVIHQIFIQYPAVHLAYKAQVPDKLTETEFWGAFFKSKYFHRDRKAGHEDMFTKYEDKEKELKGPSIDPRGIVDPLIDLTATAEDNALHHAKRPTKEDAQSITIAKFNRHGAYVLDPTHAGKLQANTETIKKARPTFHDSIDDAIVLDDLKGKQDPPHYPLTLGDESRYFQHSQQGSELGQQQLATLAQSCAQLQTACASSFKLDRAFPSSAVSLNVLSEVIANAESNNDTTSLGGGAMAADLIPNDFKKQVYNQFHDVCELLRHFLSFRTKAQTGDPESKRKLKNIVDKMTAKYDELTRIREALPPHEKNLLAPLLKPFGDQLNLAFIDE
ncbi:TPA: hypothetical protein N0F65_010021 [Lagenidium giganteum]|uniref:BSD domain-containing protein n=1 Tax=Lagenidium giganteum TaxID=4803 RepID=A0AAV2ZEV1_9STRA|nr:TPA: hypothetical protein N0F65_010021 [Lagenidium giganteum]